LEGQDFCRSFKTIEQGQDVADPPRDGELEGNLEEAAALHRRKDPLAPDFHAGLPRELFHQLLQLGGRQRGRGAREQARGRLLRRLRDLFEPGRVGGALGDEGAALGQHLLAGRDQRRLLARAGEGRFHEIDVSRRQDRHPGGHADDGALPLGQGRHGYRAPCGLAAGGAAGRPAGPAAAAVAGGVSHDALILNCSLSRPLVTGEANSTFSSLAEPSRSGMSWLAAGAWPVISTPLVSSDTVVSQASTGTSSVSSRRSGSGWSAESSTLRSVARSWRFFSTSPIRRSTAFTSGSRVRMAALRRLSCRWLW